MAELRKTEVEFEGTIEERYTAVEGETLSPWPADAPLQRVGEPTPKMDGYQRVSGSARYTADVRISGMLYGRVLRSPHAHARVRSIDSAAAQALPGVLAVLTPAAVPAWLPQGGDLFSNPVRYMGDAVAAVAAETDDVAEEALARLDVEYEILPHVATIEDAIAPGAAQIHPRGNVRRSVSTRGDIERGFADADVTVELTFRSPVQLHNALEPHGCLCYWEGQDLVAWYSTQNVFGTRKELAEAFAIPYQRVRVIKEYMGGGFGAKNHAERFGVICGTLARMANRPVRLMLDRREENLLAGNRQSTIQHLRLGARRDGTLTAIHHRDWTGGGYRGGGGVSGPVQSLYTCPNLLVESHSVRINTGPRAAFRAPSYVEGAWALEAAMDQLAHELEMDPVALRRKNYSDGRQDPYVPYSDCQLLAAYERGQDLIQWQRRLPAAGLDDGDGPVKRGMGMAATTWGGGGGPPGYAVVMIQSDASVQVVTGSQDLGTGTKTVFSQIAAEELALPLAQVTVRVGDSSRGPFAPLSAGSQTVSSVGPAVREAAADARRQLLELAAAMLEVAQEDLAVEVGRIFVQREPETGITYREICDRLGNFMVIGKGARSPNPDNRKLATFCAQFAEVEVDTRTGQVRVLKLVSVNDSGRIINRLTASSQVEGGMIQGMGFGLTEERVMDPATGRMLNPNLEEYKVPTALDMPVFAVDFTDVPDPYANNLGAKGLGEPPIIPTAPAIANAVFNATGVRITEGPLTPRRVLEALEASRMDGAGVWGAERARRLIGQTGGTSAEPRQETVQGGSGA